MAHHVRGQVNKFLQNVPDGIQNIKSSSIFTINQSKQVFWI